MSELNTRLFNVCRIQYPKPLYHHRHHNHKHRSNKTTDTQTSSHPHRRIHLRSPTTRTTTRTTWRRRRRWWRRRTLPRSNKPPTKHAVGHNRAAHLPSSKPVGLERLAVARVDDGGHPVLAVRAEAAVDEHGVFGGYLDLEGGFLWVFFFLVRWDGMGWDGIWELC